MSMSRITFEQPGKVMERPEGAIAAGKQSLLCRQCASIGHSCCQGHEIYVTWGDCRRIADHKGQKDFYEYRQCGNAEYAEQSEDPLWQQYVFRHDGSRRVLKRHANGDCCFLTPSGCNLPLTARPLVCRLYPHLYSAAGIAPEWDPECGAARTMAAAAIEQDIAGVTPIEAVQWHRLLYDEILWERPENENWLNI